MNEMISPECGGRDDSTKRQQGGGFAPTQPPPPPPPPPPPDHGLHSGAPPPAPAAGERRHHGGAASAAPSSNNEGGGGDDDDDDSRSRSPPSGRGRRTSWDGMFERLRQFRERNGTVNVGRAADAPLASWIRSQRRQYRLLRDGSSPGVVARQQQPGRGDDGDDGDRDRLTPERVVELERLGLEWDVRAENEAAWRDRLEDLRLYRTVRGHCLVPARYPANPQLGHWVMTQRRQFCLMRQKKPSTLTEERMRQLDELGFTWTTRDDPEFVWNQRLQELREYKAQHGDCLVPQRWPSNPQLGTWVNTQRRHYKLLRDGRRSSMTPERIRTLESVGFSWSSPKMGSLEAQLGTLRKEMGEGGGGERAGTGGGGRSAAAAAAAAASCRSDGARVVAGDVGDRGGGVVRRNHTQMAGGVGGVVRGPATAAPDADGGPDNKRQRLFVEGRDGGGGGGGGGGGEAMTTPSLGEHLSSAFGGGGGDRRQQLPMGFGSHTPAGVIPDPSQSIASLQRQIEALADPALIAAGRHLAGGGGGGVGMMGNAAMTTNHPHPGGGVADSSGTLAPGIVGGVGGGGGGAVAAPPPGEGGGAWVCSFCRAASFGSYEDACLHEMRCAIAARQCAALY